MLSKQQIQFVRSLHQKKFRQMYRKFLVEGAKQVRELLTADYEIDTIYSTANFTLPLSKRKYNHAVISENELKKISTHENPDEAIAVVQIPNQKSEIGNQKLNDGLYLALDNLNDPGNAGSIIRIADWFGITKIFFSENSVDVYNPKVVNAAKGSLFRVQCIYADLKKLFEANAQFSVYGTFMRGENIYKAKLNINAIILIGNEANGISDELLPFITQKISIPSFGAAESLNAAVATGIVVSEFRRG